MTCLGIIGTAGRREDAAKLTPIVLARMGAVAQTAAITLGATKLVSGGAAYADHLAIHLFLRGQVMDLLLHLPVAFAYGCYDEGCSSGRACNHYHRQFREQTGHDSLQDITDALKRGAGFTIEHGPTKGYSSMFARNAKVAASADILLAFTFGESGFPALKDGGTSHTMDTFLRRRETGPDLKAFHYNLTDSTLYIL
jgi:hypothetical protein